MAAAIAAAIGGTVDAAEDARAHRFVESQLDMMAYDGALWDARLRAAGSVGRLLRAPRGAPWPPLRRLDLGGVLVTGGLLAGVAEHGTLAHLVLSTLAGPTTQPGGPAPDALATLVRGLPRLTSLALRRMPEPQPFWHGRRFTVGDPPALAAAAAAAPALIELVAEDVCDEQEHDSAATAAGGTGPQASSPRSQLPPPLPVGLARLVEALAGMPRLARAELTLRDAPNGAPPPPWRATAHAPERLVLGEARVPDAQ